MTVESISETVVLHVPGEGRPIGTGQDALDVVGDAWAAAAELIAVPVGRLAPEFFDLRTGLAGEFIQKVVTYRLRLAVLGDISVHVDGSEALRDFVRESNRGTQVWFLAGRGALAERLAVG